MKLEKKKKEKLSALKKKADTVFSIYIRRRDHGKCITCGTQKEWKEMQAGHYVSRACLPLRYSPENVHCQCYGCNCMKHGDLITYREKLVELYGEPLVLEMELRRHDSCKTTAQDYHELIDKYRELIEKL